MKNLAAVPMSAGSTAQAACGHGPGTLCSVCPSACSGTFSASTLDLHGSGISGTLPPELGAVLGLQELDLHDNSISGTIPPQLGYLSTLTSLQLQGNPVWYERSRSPQAAASKKLRLL